MFVKASRLKLRFDSPTGKLSVEDLWDLPLTSNTGKANIDDIAKALSRTLKSSDSEESFVLKTKPSDNINQLKFDIIKHVITTRLAENEEAAKALENKAKKQQIMQILSNKQNSALESMSAEDLQKMLDSL